MAKPETNYLDLGSIMLGGSRLGGRLESMSGNRKERGRKDIETVLTEDEAPSSGEFEPVQGSAGVIRDKGCV